jgi:hypothetical protein
MSKNKKRQERPEALLSGKIQTQAIVRPNARTKYITGSASSAAREQEWELPVSALPASRMTRP